MRLFIGCLLLVLLGLQYKLWLGDGSIVQWVALEKQLAHQKEENKKLSARNRALEADVMELKSGDQALEERARYELGMVKDGEDYYHFVD
ncbi:cell division protein FtsB [Legionella impletisoli]|uniref:Cell division protein FtsB n=1 Tax=Legionella impletisoli TaxID=343510 RepID=A0A917JR58_9GAMM|nr:cell division protein FtsB [Legionella impletisoli]GGI82919.1 cell division protein FtsB [Legionella impletisoli]